MHTPHRLSGPMLALLVLAVTAPEALGQMQWTRRLPGTSPSARYQHTMVYDSARRRVVLFGAGPRIFRNDTWEWDGNDWQLRIPATSPPINGGGAMAYDAARQRTVLFGLNNNLNTYDTWEWDGVNWTQCTPTRLPLAQGGTAMAYDGNLQRVILFGGSVLSRVALNETWAWDGVNWTRLVPAMAPPARYSHAMAYDSARRRIVLFGGICGSYLYDTWEWQGTTWIPCSTPVVPSPRDSQAMVYDAATQRVVLFGGNNSSYAFNDTWEWDGKTWVQRALTSSPLGRFYHAMAYDAARQRTILFGGFDGQMTYFGDTWDYGSTHLSVAGLPRPGNTMTFTLSAQRDAGRSFQMASSLGTGPTWIGPVDVGLDADALLTVSVTGAWPGVFQGYQGTLDGNGQATTALHIPPFPLLIGITVHSAFLTFDTQATPAIRSVSGTESLQIMR
jgi:hypothetical protein